MGVPALNASSYRRIIGANEKIRIGFIGVGNQGSLLLNDFKQYNDFEVAALCNVYEPYINRNLSQVDSRYLQAMSGQVPEMKEEFIKQPKIYIGYPKPWKTNGW